LLSPDRWHAALAANGFVASASLPEDGSPAWVLGQHVILARGPQETAASSPQPTGAGAGHQRVAGVTATAADAAPSLLDELATASPAERHERLVRFVRDAVARVLRLDPAQAPGSSARLMESGVDSLMAVELRSLLARGLRTTRRIPATLIFDYPTIDLIAGFVGQMTDAESSSGTPPRARSAEPDPAVAPAALAALDDAAVEALIEQRLLRMRSHE
jgi:polyketide synthase 12/myxalamid-type polyketide synthase MxaB